MMLLAQRDTWLPPAKWEKRPPPRYFGEDQSIPAGTEIPRLGKQKEPESEVELLEQALNEARRIKWTPYEMKNPRWLARRTQQTASAAAANLGLSPYRDNSPHMRWAIMSGNMPDLFRGNAACSYGELHEPRLRAIARRVLGIRITEYGLFQDVERPYLGVSPDGITNAVRIVGKQPYWDPDEQGWKLADFNVTLGKIMYEAKCSPNHAYLHPQVCHNVQVAMQEYVSKRAAAILHYWSRDRTRMFLILYSEQFTLWMLRRMDLMNEHVIRNIQPCETNPFFNWRKSSGTGGWRYKQTLADYCAEEWFSHSKRTGSPLRRPCTLQDWDDEMAALGLTHEEYLALNPAYRDSAPVITTDPETGKRTMKMDPGMFCAPVKPPTWEIFCHTRPVPANEADLMQDDCYIKPVPETDLDFFESQYPPISQYYQKQLDDFERFKALPIAPWISAMPDAPFEQRDLVMDRLFIERVESVPELDEPEPKDQSNVFATAEEREAYEARVTSIWAKIVKDIQEKGLNKPEHVAAPTPRARPTGDSTAKRVRRAPPPQQPQIQSLLDFSHHLGMSVPNLPPNPAPDPEWENRPQLFPDCQDEYYDGWPEERQLMWSGMAQRMLSRLVLPRVELPEVGSLKKVYLDTHPTIEIKYQRPLLVMVVCVGMADYYPEFYSFHEWHVAFGTLDLDDENKGIMVQVLSLRRAIRFPEVVADFEWTRRVKWLGL